MDKESKLHSRIFDFIMRQISELKENYRDYRTYTTKGKIEERRASGLRAAANAAVLLIIGGATTLVMAKAYNFISGIWIWLSLPQHMALRTIAIGVGAIFLIAIILEQYKRKDEPAMTEKELDLNYKRGAESVYLASQPINNELGLKVPGTVSELSTSSSACCHEVSGVWHYTYLLLIDRTACTEIDTEMIREMYNTRFLQMEAAMQLPASQNPLGYKFRNKFYCSLLVMNVVQSGDFVKLDLALASDSACELFDRRKPLDGGVLAVDEEI
jgi:hypothetical protein